MTYSNLSCKLVTSFSIFSNFILSEKKVSPYEIHVIFQGIEHQLQENIHHYFCHYSFFIKIH